MATQLNLTVPAIPVQNTDVEFEVRQNGTLLGRLRTSRGGLDWFKANARQRTGRAKWAELKEWMES